jgi:hypothetical protein
MSPLKKSEGVKEQAKAEAKAIKEQAKAEAKAMKEQAKAEAKAIKEQEKAEAKAIKEKEKAEAKAMKEKEKAEAKAMKEKDKAKAKAMKEKDKAKAKAIKEKEKAKAMKEKEKVKVMKEKEKAKAMKEKEKAAAKAAKAPKAAKAAKAPKVPKAPKAPAPIKPISPPRLPSLPDEVKEINYNSKVANAMFYDLKLEVAIFDLIKYRVAKMGLRTYYEDSEASDDSVNSFEFNREEKFEAKAMRSLYRKYKKLFDNIYATYRLKTTDVDAYVSGKTHYDVVIILMSPESYDNVEYGNYLVEKRDNKYLLESIAERNRWSRTYVKLEDNDWDTFFAKPGFIQDLRAANKEGIKILYEMLDTQNYVRKSDKDDDDDIIDHIVAYYEDPDNKEVKETFYKYHSDLMNELGEDPITPPE